MAIKINLLKNRHTLSEGDYQRERVYYRYSLMGVVFVVVITLAVSIWQFALTRELNAIEVRVGKSTKELVGLSAANAKQIYLKSRLKMITAFLDERSVARQALQKIFSTSIPGVAIAGASFESDNVIKMQATAESVLTLTDFIDYLEQDSEFFLQVVSRGINRLQDGKYQIEVSLTIPKG